MNRPSDAARRWATVLITASLALVATAGCGSADLPQSVAPTTVPVTSTTIDTAALESELDPTCVAGGAVEPGTTVESVRSGGVPRTYLQHIPLTYEGVGMPVVVALHDEGGTAADLNTTSALVDAAEAAGFVLLTPQGRGEPAAWDASPGSTDVAFIADMVAQAQDHFCLESQRVYALGLGVGGALAGRLSCDLSDLMAAVAGVADVGLPVDCDDQQRPVPLLGVFSAYANVDETLPGEGLEQWAAHYGCEPPSPTVDMTDDVLEVTLEGCGEGAAVDYALVSAGDLTPSTSLWPGAGSLQAADLIWPFFVLHPLTGAA